MLDDDSPMTDAMARLYGYHPYGEKRGPLASVADQPLNPRSSAPVITINCEAVVCGPDWFADFDRLRSAISRRTAPEAFACALDLIELDGRDLRRSFIGTTDYGPMIQSVL
jgi:hypothetical protein